MSQSAAEPDFIIDGRWVDPDPNPILGCRQHPFGPDAWIETVDGVRMIFRDRAARDAYLASR